MCTSLKRQLCIWWHYWGLWWVWHKVSEWNGVFSRKFKGESVVVAILPSHMEVSYCTSGFFGSGGIEKSHSCKWAKWIQWHALPHIQQSTQQRNKGYYPNLHGWDFSIPPSPVFFIAKPAKQFSLAWVAFPAWTDRTEWSRQIRRYNINTHLHAWRPVWPPPHSIKTEVKTRPDSPFKIPTCFVGACWVIQWCN